MTTPYDRASVNRAVIFSEPGTTKTEIVELPIETPGPGEILVRLLYSGVCHSDYSVCTNAWKGIGAPTPKGQVGGHEGIGEVIARGPNVNSPSIGTNVGIKWTASACLTCDRCLDGAETCCASAKVSGFFTPGTFQQYCITSALYATPIPTGIDLAGAAPLMCGGITVYTALKRVQARSGDWVLISGAGGGLGHLAIQYAKAIGARVLALELSKKEKLCRDLGADAFLDFTKFASNEELTAEVHRISGGVNTVLLCSSSNKAYDQAVSFLRFRGTLVCIGVPEGESVPIGGARVGSLASLELNIMGVKSGNRQDARECLEFAARGLVKTHYTLRPMEDVTAIFKEMEAGTINGRAVIDLR